MANKTTKNKKVSNASKDTAPKKVSANAKSSREESNVKEQKISQEEKIVKEEKVEKVVNDKKSSSEKKVESVKEHPHEAKSVRESNTSKYEEESQDSSIIWKVIAGIAILAVVLFLIVKGCGRSKEFEVTFDTQGGSEVTSITVKKDDTIKEPEIPTKEGYIFEGWYYENQKFDFDTKIKEDITLVAKWSLADNLELKVKEMSLQIGDKTNLTVTNLPSGVSSKDLVWTSSDESVVTVDQNGNVKALKAGTANITLKTSDGKYSVTCKVTVVSEKISPSSVSISGNSVVAPGDSLKLRAVIKPSNATNQNVTWSSSDASIATVDEDGNVKALKEGTVTITVTTEDGKKTASKKITVSAQKGTSSNNNSGSNNNKKVSVTDVTINSSDKTMTVGDKATLKVTIKPSNATNKKVTWKSSNPSVVSVDANGNIKALRKGTVRITVTTEDGKKVDSIVVTVKEKTASYEMTLSALVGANGDVAQYEVAITKDGKPLADSDYTKVVFKAGSEEVVFRTKNPTLQHGRFSNTSSITKGTITLADGKTSTITIRWGKDKNREL